MVTTMTTSRDNDIKDAFKAMLLKLEPINEELDGLIMQYSDKNKFKVIKNDIVSAINRLERGINEH